MSDESLVSIVAISCLFGGPLLWGLVNSLASHWRKLRIEEQQLALKRDMIERGYLPEEIVRVLEAGTTPEREAQHAVH